jgi:hypothetical protein
MGPSPEGLLLARFVLAPGMAVISVAFLGYQLWTGKAGAWAWQTKSKDHSFFLLRSEQPLAYWFRIALWAFISCVWLVFAVVGIFA